ncbi:hypothetical protein [Vulcanisaeta thermophila]|uniref:hypothetical protein n=1 Tax=Vulcanisaeta thermophila TaxID=867917 RepID=UPI0008529282|nr:hypothetical protein [Vulcanisaeta thermophila]
MVVGDLYAKIRRAFGDYDVDKSLLHETEISRLPGFIAEYLITEYAMEYPNDWQTRLREFIKRHYFEAIVIDFEDNPWVSIIRLKAGRS